MFNVTVHGSFQFWTGAEFVTMTQDPPAQRQENCFSPTLTREILLGGSRSGSPKLRGGNLRPV